MLYLNQAAQPHPQRLEVSWGWLASMHDLLPTLPPLQSLYKRSLGREYPLYGAVSTGSVVSGTETAVSLSAPVLANFDKEAHTRVIADASPVGLHVGAVLVQEKNGVGRAVCYASRSLSSVERRYSQTEKEALALVWAYKRFNLYLYCLQTFDLVTDHEALKVIYSRGSKPSARIERWVLRLQPYSYKVCCVASRDNIADALSRLTTLPASDNAPSVREVSL